MMGRIHPHSIPAESVKKGDTIEATWKVGSVEHMRRGTVDRIIFDHGKRSRSFVTAEGDEIMHWTPDSRVKLTLVAEKPVIESPLWTFPTMDCVGFGG